MTFGYAKGYLQSGRNEEFKEMLTGAPASPRPKPPHAFPTQLFSFYRLSWSLEQVTSKSLLSRSVVIEGECFAWKRVNTSVLYNQNLPKERTNMFLSTLQLMASTKEDCKLSVI